MRERGIALEFDGATKPGNGLFVRAKVKLGGAGNMHPQPHETVTRREAKRLILVTLGLLGATVI